MPAEPEEGEEEEAEDAKSMGEQKAMDDDPAYASTSPAGEDEQDMGLLSVMDTCPVLSHSMCEEGEELGDIIDKTCVLSVVVRDTRKAFRARAKENPQATEAEIYSPPRVTGSAMLLPSWA